MPDVWNDPIDRVLRELISPAIWNEIAADIRLLGAHSHTGAAGDGANILPTYVTPSHFWLNLGDGLTNAGTMVGAANQVRVCRFYLPFKLTVNFLTINILTLQAGSTAGVGIYNADGTTLLASGTASSASTGVKRIAVTTVTLDAGFYLLAWTNTGNVAVAVNVAVPNANFVALFNDNAVQVGNAANSSAVGVLPATTGVITGAQFAFPIIKLEG